LVEELCPLIEKNGKFVAFKFLWHPQSTTLEESMLTITHTTDAVETK
jgi:hypothetical protein